MKIYTVYIDPNDEKPHETAEFIPEGFCWWMFIPIANIFWGLYNKSWRFSLLVFLVEAIYWAASIYLVLEYGATTNAFDLTRYLILFYFALTAHDFIRSNLERRGYVLDDIISGKGFMESEGDAQQRYFEKVSG